MQDLGTQNATQLYTNIPKLIKAGQSFRFIDKKTLSSYIVTVEKKDQEIMEREDGSRWQRIG